MLFNTKASDVVWPKKLGDRRLVEVTSISGKYTDARGTGMLFFTVTPATRLTPKEILSYKGKVREFHGGALVCLPEPTGPCLADIPDGRLTFVGRRNFDDLVKAIDIFVKSV